jgi:glucose/arabinose dehydrogenase
MKLLAPLSLLAAGLLAAHAFSQATPIGTVRIAGGIARPIWVGQAPGETDPTRLFVVEQKQADVHIVLNGVVQEPPFLDLATTKVQTSGNEQGLLGLTFHPDFQNNGLFYVNFTAVGGGATFVERYGVIGSPATATAADVSSVTVIIGPITQPQSNHNGGNIAFGPDGKLYVGMGDGGNFNDQGTGHVAGGNAQSGANLLGKMLRLNDDGTVPGDNPFLAPMDGIMDQILHLGLRNPWRFSFDSETGDLWIGDVGQDAVEEIDFVPAGASGRNFGWRCMEGFSCTGLSGCTCNAPTLTLPIHDYTHAGGNCSVTGGGVYRGEAIPDLGGTYFFADYCSSQIWSLEYDGVSVSNFTNRTASLAPGGGFAINSVTSFGTDTRGEIYICDQTGGEIFKIVPKNAFTGLGCALAGTNGKPVLWGDGAFTANGAGTLRLENALPGANALLFVGLVEGAAPFKGGVIKPVPFLLALGLGVDPNGRIDLPYLLPAAIPTGTLIAFQYAIQDPGAINGAALSNALKGVTTP